MIIKTNSDSIVIYPFATETTPFKNLAKHDSIKVNHPKIQSDSIRGIEFNINMSCIDRSSWVKLCKAVDKAFKLQVSEYGTEFYRRKTAHMTEEIATKLAQEIGRAHV